MSRSAVQVASGCRSLLTALVSATVLLLLVLWVGPVFEPLPTCVMAAIIVVAVKGMLEKVVDVKIYYKRLIILK